MKNKNKVVLPLSLFLLLNPVLNSLPVYALDTSNIEAEGSAPESGANFEEVNIPDENLKAVLMNSLNKDSDSIITKDDLEKITYLNAYYENIKDLTGLEYCINLRDLNLDYNHDLVSFEPLRNLTSLTRLSLDNTNFKDLTILNNLSNLEYLSISSNDTDYDLSKISNLTHLESLSVSDNPLIDISPLRSLTNLYSLNISSTNLTDFSPLKDLPNLKDLNASGYDFNKYDYLDYVPNLDSLISNYSDISDISKLTSLSNLTSLSLMGNNISDISPLANLKALCYIDLDCNKISDISPLKAFKDALDNNNIYIYLTSQDINLDDCSSYDSFNLPLSIKDLNGNLITDISDISNDGVYDDNTNEIKWNEEQAGSNVYYEFYYSYNNLHFSGTPSTNLVKLYTPDYYEEVNIPDTNLKEKILSSLGMDSNSIITKKDLLSLTSLYANSSNISDLTGLEYCTNLEYLDLYINSISDISPLKNLSKLSNLELDSNCITDISVLTNLTNLNEVFLRYNSISNVPDLSNLTNLNHAYIEYQSIILPEEKFNGDYTLKMPITLFNKPVTHIDFISNDGVYDESSNTITWRNSLNDLSYGPCIYFSENESFGSSKIIYSGSVNLNLKYVEKDLTIEDQALKTALLKAVNKNENDTLTKKDLKSIETLNLVNAGVTSLKGLEYCTSLKKINLTHNNIKDYSPLSTLISLQEVSINNANLTDISFLSNLTNLKTLNLGNNEISDLSPLTSLVNMETLFLLNNKITDISPLKNMKNLKFLNISKNQVTDLSPLSKIPSIFKLLK